MPASGAMADREAGGKIQRRASINVTKFSTCTLMRGERGTHIQDPPAVKPLLINPCQLGYFITRNPPFLSPISRFSRQRQIPLVHR